MTTPEETSDPTEIKKKKKEGPGRKELALERTVLALERTLASWVRTNASFITFGFAIYKLLESRAESGKARLLLGMLGPREIGIIMIITGFIGLLLAVVRHYMGMNMVQKFGKKHFSVSLIQAYVMLALSALLIYGALTAKPEP